MHESLVLTPAVPRISHFATTTVVSSVSSGAPHPEQLLFLDFTVYIYALHQSGP